MPNRGPVYQPTTESYGQQGEWRSPSGLLAQTTTSAGRSRCLQWVTLGLFVLGTFSLRSTKLLLSQWMSQWCTSGLVSQVVNNKGIIIIFSCYIRCYPCCCRISCLLKFRTWSINTCSYSSYWHHFTYNWMYPNRSLCQVFGKAVLFWIFSKHSVSFVMDLLLTGKAIAGQTV